METQGGHLDHFISSSGGQNLKTTLQKALLTYILLGAESFLRS